MRGNLYDAVLTLVGPGHLNRRLVATAQPLWDALAFAKDPEVKERIEDVLGKLEAKPPRGGFRSAIEATVFGMIPARARWIAREILELYLFAAESRRPHGPAPMLLRVRG